MAFSEYINFNPHDDVIEAYLRPYLNLYIQKYACKISRYLHFKCRLMYWKTSNFLLKFLVYKHLYCVQVNLYKRDTNFIQFSHEFIWDYTKILHFFPCLFECVLKFARDNIFTIFCLIWLWDMNLLINLPVPDLPCTT